MQAHLGQGHPDLWTLPPTNKRRKLLRPPLPILGRLMTAIANSSAAQRWKVCLFRHLGKFPSYLTHISTQLLAASKCTQLPRKFLCNLPDHWQLGQLRWPACQDTGAQPSSNRKWPCSPGSDCSPFHRSYQGCTSLAGNHAGNITQGLLSCKEKHAMHGHQGAAGWGACRDNLISDAGV